MIPAALNATGTIDFIAEDGCDNLVDLSLKDGDKELDVVLQFDGF
ncbi:MAG: hypothetical protein U5L96_07635 [Owenweeksia sp.]|nr:hypothetical protein [Owenweeksia sp.]